MGLTFWRTWPQLVGIPQSIPDTSMLTPEFLALINPKLLAGNVGDLQGYPAPKQGTVESLP